MPSRHSSHHSSSSHSSSHHSSSHIHHSTPIHHTTTHFPSSSSDPLNSSYVAGPRPGSRGCLYVVVAFIVIILGSVGFTVYSAIKGAGSIVSSFANSSGSNSVQATTTADIAQMNHALSPHLSAWKETSDGQTTIFHVSASDAGFTAADNTKEVIYGRCSNNLFYVYVFEQSSPEGSAADTEGYAYIPGGKPATCLPDGFQIIESDSATADWTFVTLVTRAATMVAVPTVASPSQ